MLVAIRARTPKLEFEREGPESSGWGKFLADRFNFWAQERMCKGLQLARMSLCAVAWCSISAEASATSLTFVYPAEKNAVYDAVADILMEAYGSLGIAVRFGRYSDERGLAKSSSGQLGGEIARFADIERKYSTLIRIPVSHAAIRQTVFARDQSIEIGSWRDLKPYSLVFHEDFEIAKRKTRGMNRVLSTSDSEVFKLLSQGSKDLALAGWATGTKAIKRLRLKNVYALSPPLQIDPLFHYLHKKHFRLVSKITFVMKNMKASGRMDEILREFGVLPVGTTAGG